MRELYCVCGRKATETTEGYTCFRCSRKYSVKGKLINSFIEFSERAKRTDDKTMHYYPEEDKRKDITSAIVLHAMTYEKLLY